jgi:hypothetical protein
MRENATWDNMELRANKKHPKGIQIANRLIETASKWRSRNLLGVKISIFPPKPLFLIHRLKMFATCQSQQPNSDANTRCSGLAPVALGKSLTQTTSLFTLGSSLAAFIVHHFSKD